MNSRRVVHILLWFVGLLLVRIDAHLYWGQANWQSLALYAPGALLLAFASPFRAVSK